MKKAACLIILIIVVTFLFYGCAEFFEFNLFAGLDPVILPDVNTMSTDDALDELGDFVDSDTGIEKIAQEPEKKAEYEEFLTTTAAGTTGASQEQAATAASILGELELKTSGAYDVVQGIVGVLAEQGSMDFTAFDPSTTGSGSEEELQDLLSKVMIDTIGTDVINNEAQFAQVVQGFLAADTAYDQLGTLLGSDPTLLGDTNLGEIVMDAALSSAMTEVIKAITVMDDATGNAIQTNEQAIAELHEFVVGFMNNPDSPPDNLDALGAVFADSARNPVGTPEFTNLLDAAGLSDLIQTGQV